jgi:hypothetical protein
MKSLAALSSGSRPAHAIAAILQRYLINIARESGELPGDTRTYPVGTRRDLGNLSGRRTALPGS